MGRSKVTNKPPPPIGGPVGRPSDYNIQTAQEICYRMAGGETVLSISLSEHMPTFQTIYRWLQQNPEFREPFTRARELQQHYWGDEIQDIAKDRSRDIIEDEVITESADGQSLTKRLIRKSDNTSVNRDKLICDNRWRIMQTVAAGTYGPRSKTELTGKDGADLFPSLTITVKK